MVEFWEICYGMVGYGMRRDMVFFSNRQRNSVKSNTESSACVAGLVGRLRQQPTEERI